MIQIPTNREPYHPGEIILKEYLDPLGITQTILAKDLLIPYQRINEIINRRRGVTLSTALRLAKYFNTSPSFWMNLQLRWDMYHAMKKEEKILKSIHTFIR